MTVKELLSRIDSHELAEWLAYYEMCPWGEERADLRTGIVAATLVNVNGGRAKPSDFLPAFGQTKPEQTPEEIRNMALKINAMFRGTVR